MSLSKKLTQAKSTTTINEDVEDSSPVELIRALSVIIPGTGPGGYFGLGSRTRNLDEDALGNLLISKIARTQVRAWMELEMGSEFGLDREGAKPSLQIEIKPDRPFPNISLKWNRETRGTTSRLQIEDATIRYLRAHFPTWGNNRSPNNNYVAGSTLARGFEAPAKTVYFDHLAWTQETPIAHEAFTGRTPGTGDIEAWIFLANGVVKPGMIINFQNGVGQSINQRTTCELVSAGYQVSVVPYSWWSRYLPSGDSMPLDSQFFATRKIPN